MLKCHWMSHIYGFLSMFNGFLLICNRIVTYIGPNMAPLRGVRLQNLGDLEFDFSRSLKVKSNGAVGLPMYDFLLVSNSNNVSKSHRLGVRAT